MYEDVNDDNVLLWACFDCGASGALHRPPVVDPEELARAIARAHADRMPGCARVFRGMSVHDFRAHDWLRDFDGAGPVCHPQGFAGCVSQPRDAQEEGWLARQAGG